MQLFVGSTQIQIKDEPNNISFPVLIQYPTLQQSTPTSFGPYTMDVSPNGELLNGHFPLVIISHGNGGSHLIYRTISTFLAKNGYIVAMLEHYGNNRNNNTLENTIENLKYRPRHVALTINNILSNPLFSQHISTTQIAIIGHSMGGYTALALAGGIPHTKEGKKVEVQSDPRVKAIVLMAPGAGWFKKSMDNVSTPILLLTAEHDNITPAWNTEVIMNSIPDKSLVTFKMVKNAGHFSFISPFPDKMKNPNFPPSTDPTGFDREEYHKHLPKEIFDFLNEKLNIYQSL